MPVPIEYLDYIPFLQFIRDDKETASIMLEAHKVIPKVLLILNNGSVNNISSQAPGVVAPLPETSSNLTTQESPAPTITSNNTSNSSSSVQSGPVKRSSSSTNSVHPKKARLRVATPEGQNPEGQTESEAGNSTPSVVEPSSSPQLTQEQTHHKLLEDYEKFVHQIGQLASLEREKNKLLQKFLNISSSNPSPGPSTSNNTPEPGV